MSPTPLNYAIDFVLGRALRSSHGVVVEKNFSMTYLTYADAIALLGDSMEAIQVALNNINRYSKVVGLRIKNEGDVNAAALRGPARHHSWLRSPGRC